MNMMSLILTVEIVKHKRTILPSLLVKTLKMKSSASGAIPGHSLFAFVIIYIILNKYYSHNSKYAGDKGAMSIEVHTICILFITPIIDSFDIFCI